jgi:hypothetical protein
VSLIEIGAYKFLTNNNKYITVTHFSLVCIGFLVFFLPESPLWLLKNSPKEDTKQNLEQIMKETNASDSDVQSLLKALETENGDEEDFKKVSLWSTLSQSNFRVVSVMLGISWLIVSL